MKQCFTPHALMHSLAGLGIGIILVSLIPSLASLWLGLALVVIAVVWDMMRKN